MKGGKDGEKAMGPMFPRIHLNDTSKGGPRAPPRNKMALYEQLSITSHRFSHLSPNPNLIQGSVSDRGTFFSQPMPPGHPHARQYSQHSNISTQSPQVEQGNKPDEDDFSVPIFTHPVPNKNQEKTSTSNPTHYQYPLESQMDKDTGTAKHSPDREGENKNGEISENHSPPDNIAAEALCDGIGQTVNLERGDSVSEDSVLDVVCEVDWMTPDDVVGVIGQKHFWKARRAIVNQQRVFAVQVFELHRLIKVQRSIAAAPHLLLEASSYFSKPTKPSPPKKHPLDNTLRPSPNDPKRKMDPKSSAREIECSAENILEKISSSHSSQSGALTNGSYSVTKPCLNQPQGHRWLIPIMSPSEGLVYKPYPGPGFDGQPCGPYSTMANFFSPTYDVSTLLPQYHFPSFPPFGYFPQYGMPVMNACLPANVPGSGPNFSILPMAGQSNGLASEEGIGCQSSKVSNPSDKQVAGWESSGAEEQNVLSLFPVGTGNGASDSMSQDSGPDAPSRVIKVVPRNGVSASEHAARIFVSIQEERRQFDSV